MSNQKGVTVAEYFSHVTMLEVMNVSFQPGGAWCWQTASVDAQDLEDNHCHLHAKLLVFL